MNSLFLIEALGSILYVTQKVFLSFGKRIGWIFSFFGAIALTIVTLNKGVYAYSVLEITSGIIFIFGFFAWQKHEKMQRRVTVLMSSLAVTGTFVIFFLNLESPHWILEDTMVILFAAGAVFLVLRRPIGWLLHLLGHLVLIILAYLLGTYFILGLQVVSIPFSIIGFKNLKKNLNN